MPLPSRLMAIAPALAFLLPALEMVLMAGPFAAYFYGAYSPVLAWTTTSPNLIWLADFFIPHLTRPESLVVRMLFGAPRVLLYVGLASFLIHATYLYWTKFKRKTVARALLYGHLRHPQYVSLAVAGIGLVFHWPRFINLVLYFVMVGGYYLLARSEEARMERGHGESYRAYKANTPMFLPAAVATPISTRWDRLPRSIFVRGAAVAVLAGIAFSASILLRTAAARTREDEVIAGHDSAVILFLRRPEGAEWTSIREGIGRLLPGTKTTGAIPVFYVIPGKQDLQHLLVDSGFAYPKIQETGVPEASLYVIEARASYPCPSTCKVMTAPREALSAQALRAPLRLYYRPGGPGQPLREHPFSSDALYAHAMMPSL